MILKKILELQNKLIEHHSEIDRYYGISKESKNKFFKYYKGSIYSKNRTLLVALINNKLIGYISGSVKKKSPHYTIKKIGNIDEVFVLEKYRKKGVAKKLFEIIMEWFKKKSLSVIEVEVDSRNDISVNTWKALGFREYTKKFKMEI